MTQTLLIVGLGACGGGGKTTDSAGGSTTAPQTTSDSSGSGGTTMATSSAATTVGSDSDSQATTSAPTTGLPGTSTSTGPDPGTSTGETSKGETSKGEESTSKGDESTSKGDESTSKGDESTTKGEECVGMEGSCAKGELCCDGLDCCAGIPVPEGKEFCSNTCPISDRNAKTDIRPVDASDILRRVVSLEVSSWRYKKDAPEVRHLGPMAQDFKGAFGLWDTDRMIFPLDGVGVSVVAIQALHQRVVDAEAENEALRERMTRIEAQLAELQGAAR